VRHLLEESRAYQFSQQEFEAMLRSGWFDPQSAELVDGSVYVRNGTGKRLTRQWTRNEYVQMSDWGWFVNCKVHLIGGEVIEMASQLNAHSAGVTLSLNALQAVFAAGYWVRSQTTLDLSPYGVPDPDLAVILGDPRSAAPHAIPTSALLVVEISESTLRDDRTIMASLYAAGNIADYWIVNLVQRQLEVYRNRVADPARQFGWTYGDRTILDPGDSVAPLALQQARIAVSDLLP
jgi:Uma2 family endonuclease